MRDSKIALVGLGMVGETVGRALLAAGHGLVVYDILPEKISHLHGFGAETGEGPADLARRAAIQICLVETTAQAEQVILGDGGFLEGARPGDLIVLMSTIDWQAVRKLGAALALRGIGFIDAPVSGMSYVQGVLTANLKCFVGGSQVDIERARPLLESCCSQILRWGDVGSGTAFKLLNSMLNQTSRIVAAEVLALGAKAGLDPELVYQALADSPSNSGPIKMMGPRALARDFEGIRMGIVLKDVELQLSLGKALEMPMPMTAQGQQIYHMARAMGFGEQDGAAVIKVYEDWTKTPFVPRPKTDVTE